MTLIVAVSISTALLVVLAAATWWWIPSREEVKKIVNLAISKNIEKQVTLELDFHEKLNNIYTPPFSAITGPMQTNVFSDEIRNLARDYTEKRDDYLSARDRIKSTRKAITFTRHIQFLNVIIYIIFMSISLLAHSEGFYRIWIYSTIWLAPWLLLFGLNKRQDRLLRIYDE